MCRRKLGTLSQYLPKVGTGVVAVPGASPGDDELIEWLMTKTAQRCITTSRFKSLATLFNREMAAREIYISVSIELIELMALSRQILQSLQESPKMAPNRTARLSIMTIWNRLVSADHKTSIKS